MRAQYAALESAIERHVHEIRDSCEPDYSQFNEFTELPSELPQIKEIFVEYVYIINLDCEVLTMNYGIHWKLGNIPRHDNLWLRAITDSIYKHKPTISLDLCPEEHMADLALQLPEPDWRIGYPSDVVSPKTNITETRSVFLTYVLAKTIIEYRDEIIRFGREWSPDSFPFRELIFALVSIASGRTGFHSFPTQRCHPHRCEYPDCQSNHLPLSPGWLGQEWAGDKAPLLEFGSMSHLPSERPGVSPAETMYWVEDVLVSLTLVVDGAAITRAVTWAIEQGHTNVQIVILNLFKAAFAEVLLDDNEKLYVQVSKPLDLSPLRAAYCMSTHPRNRPEQKPEMDIRHHRGEFIMQYNCTGSRRMLQKYFPGLAALVNFFETATNRHAASKTRGIFPPEVYDRIIDFVDYNTWKACSVVSNEFRSYCLSKYRLDDQTRLVAGPFVRLRLSRGRKSRVLSFDFENMQTGQILPMIQAPSRHFTTQLNWMPLIGSDRKALMLNVFFQFEPAEDVAVEADSEDEP
jgi:hypothetical protein